VSEENVPSEGEPQEITRPEYVPEKFWNSDNNEVNLEAAFKSYGELESKIGQKEDSLRESIETDLNKSRMEGVPDSVDGYEYKPPTLENAPEGWEVEINEEDSLLQWWKETSHAQKLTQDQYQEGIQKFFDITYSLPNKEDAVAELGENGQDRINAVDGWMASNLTEDQYNAVAEFATSAAAIDVLETLIGKTGEPDLASFGNQAPTGEVSEEKIREMMNDPRYWKTGSIDNDYKQKVTDMWAKLYSK